MSLPVCSKPSKSNTQYAINYCGDPSFLGGLIQCCYAKGGAALRSMHGKEVLNGRL